MPFDKMRVKKATNEEAYKRIKECLDKADLVVTLERDMSCKDRIAFNAKTMLNGDVTAESLRDLGAALIELGNGIKNAGARESPECN